MNMKYGVLTFLLLLGVTVSNAQMPSFDASSCTSGKAGLYVEGWNVERVKVESFRI